MGVLNPAWIGHFREGASVTLINKGPAGRVPGDDLNTRGLQAPPLKRPKYVGFRLPLFRDAPALSHHAFFQFSPCRGEAPKPAQIKDFRAPAGRRPVYKGFSMLPRRCPIHAGFRGAPFLSLMPMGDSRRRPAGSVSTALSAWPGRECVHAGRRALGHR